MYIIGDKFINNKTNEVVEIVAIGKKIDVDNKTYHITNNGIIEDDDLVTDDYLKDACTYCNTRKAIISISERTFVQALAGNMFAMAPNKQPRKAEIIMTKARDKFRELAHNDNEYYTCTIQSDINSVAKFFNDLLLCIPEVEELNLSQNEYDKNINVNDENRTKYKFTSRYDKETKESWRSDFIDLHAFVRNVINSVYTINEEYMDCYGCIHDDNEDKCKGCALNESLRINYESCRQPKGKYTMACKYNCHKGRYICCSECDDKETCEKKCELDVNKCNIVLHRK